MINNGPNSVTIIDRLMNTAYNVGLGNFLTMINVHNTSPTLGNPFCSSRTNLLQWYAMEMVEHPVVSLRLVEIYHIPCIWCTFPH